jgi:hypothetical protein
MRSVVDRNVVMRPIPVNIRHKLRLGIDGTAYILVSEFKVRTIFPEFCDYKDMKTFTIAEKYRHFGGIVCHHLHVIIRLCLKKSTESSITISIIRRGRIKLNPSIRYQCYFNIAQEHWIRYVLILPHIHAMHDVTYFVESMKCNCLRITCYWLKNPFFLQADTAEIDRAVCKPRLSVAPFLCVSVVTVRIRPRDCETCCVRRILHVQDTLLLLYSNWLK